MAQVMVHLAAAMGEEILTALALLAQERKKATVGGQPLIVPASQIPKEGGAG
jgi:hypothetical protein